MAASLHWASFRQIDGRKNRRPAGAGNRSDGAGVRGNAARSRSVPGRGVAAQARHPDIAVRVREIWKRHQLETLYKRVSAIEKRRGRTRSRLTETQQARFKRAERRSQLLTGASAKAEGEDSKSLRQHLIVIAAQTFSRHGYKGATLKEIAEIAGILPGSVYHYFRSKQALFTEVHHEGFAELNAAVDKGDRAFNGSEGAAGSRLRSPRRPAGIGEYDRGVHGRQPVHALGYFSGSAYFFSSASNLSLLTARWRSANPASIFSAPLSEPCLCRWARACCMPASAACNAVFA